MDGRVARVALAITMALGFAPVAHVDMKALEEGDVRGCRRPGAWLHREVRHQGERGAHEVKTIRPTVAEIDKGIAEGIDQWRQTFGN